MTTSLNTTGWWLAIGHLITGVLMCLTIIGIPLGLANFKLILACLSRFGARSSTSSRPGLGYAPGVGMPADPRTRGS